MPTWTKRLARPYLKINWAWCLTLLFELYKRHKRVTVQSQPEQKHKVLSEK
jgi:hypothetical protein